MRSITSTRSRTRWPFSTANRSACSSTRRADAAMPSATLQPASMQPASLQDWFDIHNVFIRYATALDDCDVGTVVTCFEPDAWLESPVLGRFDGHAGVREFALRTVRL